MAEAKPLTAQHREYEKGEVENTARRRAPAPHATEHKLQTPHIETCGQCAAMRQDAA